ncbi:ATP-binding protein [Allopusillimonas ginsengisoli]|uniref:ATP-binding protein n=1 Tax=Allopusillimonas ginsengisoli TaxID=453575 RepID=UPI0010C1D72E|nr:ATP-binding protein [Allopusillimonas ginsengisoli]
MQTIASLSLIPGPDTVAQGLAWLQSLAAQQQWPPKTSFKLELCLDEALTNVMLYGLKDRENEPASLIELEVLQNGDALLIDIIDNGRPFDPTLEELSPLATSLDEAVIGGHGLRLMRHYLKDIQYHRTEEHNHLRLIAALDANDH